MATVEQSIEQRVEALEQRVAELMTQLAEPKKAKKVKKAEAGAEPKAPSAWNQLVAQTVAEMRQSGWESWTDLKGVAWPASKRALVKDKSGALLEAWVYATGEHEGKIPTPALGGMVRASCLKAQSDPEAMAKAVAYHAKLAERRESSSASVSGASAAEPKKVRAKMTEEQKAAAAAKRAAKKAEAAAEAPEPSAEAAEPAAPKPKRVQSEGQKAWGALVAETVAQMKEHGWEAWTDAKSGAAWPASAASSAGHVFSDGPHQGKAPSNQRGGMSRASFLKAQAVGLQGEWAEMENE